MLSGIASLANSSLQGSIDDGSVNVIAEMSSDWSTADTFALRMYTGDLAPTNEDCNVSTDSCEWHLSLSSLTKDCAPLIAFNNAKIADGKLTAGGPDGVFQLTLPIAGFDLVLMVARARIEADVTIEDGNVTSINGILGGAIPKASLVEAVNALDPESLPISKDVILNILSNVIQEDMDVLDADGNPGSDGEMDASSVALIFEAIPGTIGGFEAPETTEPPSLCTQYCELAAANCTTDNAIDFGTDDCETACASMTQGSLETGEDDAVSGPSAGNSVACRIYHLTVAADDPATHCPHGNLAGGSDIAGFPCSDPTPNPPASCTEYCTLATTNCTGDDAIDFGTDGCEAACATMTEGEAGATSGDSVQCRIYHLGVAGDDPAGHCAHGNVAGGDDVVGFPCQDSEPEPTPSDKCDAPPTEFGPAFRIHSLQLGANGMSGEGLDIDGMCVDIAPTTPTE